MQQFDLSVWFQDKSRKVVTRDGRPVRIVCWDVKSISPIIGIIQDRLGGEFARNYALNGKYSTQNETEYDLFFADEEEDLTEFEQKLVEIVKSEGARIGNLENFTEKDKEALHFYSKQLLDLARKELEENYYTKVFDDRMVLKAELHATDVQTAYDMGKQDTLKDLPKWKRISKLVCLDRTNSGYFAFIGNDTSKPAICCNGYYISLADLETLPKEE